MTVESSSIQEDAHTLQPNSIHQLILPCLRLLWVIRCHLSSSKDWLLWYNTLRFYSFVNRRLPFFIPLSFLFNALRGDILTPWQWLGALKQVMSELGSNGNKWIWGASDSRDIALGLLLTISHREPPSCKTLGFSITAKFGLLQLELEQLWVSQFAGKQTGFLQSSTLSQPPSHLCSLLCVISSSAFK